MGLKSQLSQKLIQSLGALKDLASICTALTISWNNSNGSLVLPNAPFPIASIVSSPVECIIFAY
jgi:hypothetical protein